MTDARLAGLLTQVALEVDPATIQARFASLLTQVAVKTIAVPSALSTSQTTTSVQLNWAAPLDADVTLDHYEVKINNGAPINAGTALFYNFTGLTTNMSYHVSVRFHDANGEVSEWVERGVTLNAAPADNPFMDSPWNTGPPLVDADSARWADGPDFIGTGIPFQDLPEADGELGYRILPILKDGENQRVDTRQLAMPDYLTRYIVSDQSISNTAFPGAILTQLYPLELRPGTWQIKMWDLDGAGATSVGGDRWFECTGGSVARMTHTRRYVTTGTTAASVQAYATTGDIARLLQGRGTRDNGVTQPGHNDVETANVTHLRVFEAVVVVTATTQIRVRGTSDTGGGNNHVTYYGTILRAIRIG